MPEITTMALALSDGFLLASAVLGLLTLTHLLGLALGFRRSPLEFVSDVWDRRHRLRRTASRLAHRAPENPRSRT